MSLPRLDSHELLIGIFALWGAFDAAMFVAGASVEKTSKFLQIIIKEYYGIKGYARAQREHFGAPNPKA